MCRITYKWEKKKLFEKKSSRLKGRIADIYP